MACINFITKLTKQCDFCCAYCYEHPVRPSRTTLEFTSDRMRSMFFNIRDGLLRLKVQGPLQLNFILHGGEPYLYPPQFFRDSFLAADEVFFDTFYEPTFCIQTNGATPLYSYLPLLKRWRVGTGFSYDFGSSLRRSRNGTSMKQQVLRNICLLKNHGLNPAVINVVSKKNVHKAKEIYFFFKRYGVSFSLLRMIAHTPSMKRHETTAREFGEMLITIADLWLKDNTLPYIFCGQVLHSGRTLLCGSPSNCWQSKACAQYNLCIQHEGEVSSCDCSGNVAIHDQNFGNIFKDRFDKIVNHPSRLKLLNRCDSILRDHKNCKWLKYCWGGCPLQGEGGEYFKCASDCETISMLYEYLNKHRNEVKRKIRCLDVG